MPAYVLSSQVIDFTNASDFSKNNILFGNFCTHTKNKTNQAGSEKYYVRAKI